jgi:hypothetical protein
VPSARSLPYRRPNAARVSGRARMRRIDTRSREDPVRVLTEHVLRNAYLSRQDLLVRSSRSTLAEVEHLVGIQSQSPVAPFYALHSRVVGFDTDALSSLVKARKVMRVWTMRGTLHTVSAKHATALRKLTQPALDREFNSVIARRLADLAPQVLRREISAMLQGRALSTKELNAELQHRWPEHDPSLLMGAARCLLPLAQLPPRGMWGATGQPMLGLIEDHIPGRTRTVDLDGVDFVRAYLKAYGPATVQDFQLWSGLTGTSPSFSPETSDLRTFRAPDGTVYYDVHRSPRPQTSRTDKIILLAPFDGALLAHKRRDRIISPERHAAITTANGLVPATYLRNGEVAGTWSAKREREVMHFTVEAFEPLALIETEELDRTLSAMSRTLHGIEDTVLTVKSTSVPGSHSS